MGTAATIPAALKPGGLAPIERLYPPLTGPDPEWGRHKEYERPSALTNAWTGLRFAPCEATAGAGDWPQTGARRIGCEQYGAAHGKLTAQAQSVGRRWRELDASHRGRRQGDTRCPAAASAATAFSTLSSFTIT